MAKVIYVDEKVKAEVKRGPLDKFEGYRIEVNKFWRFSDDATHGWNTDTIHVRDRETLLKIARAALILYFNTKGDDP